MSPQYQILVNEKDEEEALLLLLSEMGVFYRDSGEWVPMDDPDDLPFDLEALTVRDVDSSEIERWDSK